MSDPIYGCESCRTTLGRAGCAGHRDLSPSPGANLYVTHCIHGLDLRLYPRCYLCRPVEVGALDAEDLRSISLALGHFPTWFDETAAKVQAMRDSLAEKS